MAKIRTISRSHIVHPGLEVFKDRKPGQEITLKKEDIPGLAESGWNPELDAMYVHPQLNILVMATADEQYTSTSTKSTLCVTKANIERFTE